MGVYNTYGNVQLKVEEWPTCSQFNIGDKVDLPDGIYCGFEGAVVILQGTMIAEFESVTDKWGNVITMDELISRSNPCHPSSLGIDENPVTST